ncbi:hypothetical protein [Oricola sp.]|uniref:hypothetical protein n=1 Tax=Oricola sp. TaxID=1979950 RepID=UPI0025ED5B46|nr:hypothetical protein [Oricola sp.]MCI5075595.1 hypothetical protein [Oricola sp.]
MIDTAIALAALVAALAPAGTLAHTGSHAAVEGGIVSHVLASPFHVGLIAAGLYLAGFSVSSLLRSVRAKDRRD